MKNQKGITLVALVITIIVLLILAGVSISLVVGNNGVLTQASNSVVTNKAASARQALQMAQAAVESYHYAQWAGNTSITRAVTYADSDNGLVKELYNGGYNMTADDITALLSAGGKDDFTITDKNSQEIFVFSNVSIDSTTGELTYPSGATLTVQSASGEDQGQINL